MASFRNFTAAAAAIVLPALVACDAESTTGVGTAATMSAATISDNPSSATSTGPGGTSTATYGGTLTGNVQAQISTDGQAWVSLGEPRSVSLTLASATDAVTLSASASVPVGTYAYARLVFTSGAQASLTGTIGGSSVNGTVVSLGGGQMVIQKQIQPVTLGAGTNARLAWDLNSETWLTSTALQSRTAAAAAVQSAAWAAITTE